MSRIVSRNTRTLFTTAHQRASSNATVFHNRFAHTSSKGENDKVIQSADLENVKQVEKAKIEIQKRSNEGVIRGDSQAYSTAAVESTKEPESPGANTGSGPEHNK